MDLSDIDLTTKSINGTKMFLKHPVTGEVLTRDDGEQMFIELTGPYHPDYKRAEQAITDTRLSRRKMKLKTADILAEQLELAVISSRKWNLQFNGLTPDCSPSVVRGVYSEQKTQWIREQVTDFLTDESNFLTARSSTNSDSGANGVSA